MSSNSSTGHNTPSMKLKQNHCFGCGADNPDGMHLHFEFDEPNLRAVCHFNLPKKFEGPPGHAHGGIIATILDEAMGKINKMRSAIALTKTMEIEYLRPVPLATDLIVTGSEQSLDGRKHTNVAEITNAAGDVLARGKGLFIAVDPQKMFEKHFGSPLPPA